MPAIPRQLIGTALLLRVGLWWMLAGELLSFLSVVPVGKLRHVNNHLGCHTIHFSLLW